MSTAPVDVDADLRAIENAVGLLKLRTATDEWSRAMGEKMSAGFTNKELAGALVQYAAAVFARFVDEEAE